MPNETPKIKYCFDTSAFVNGWRRYYKPKSFLTLWNHIGEMMDKGLIIVPEEVFKEIGAGTDDLVSWFKQHKSCIVPITQDQLIIVSDMINKYHSLAEYKSSKVYSADTFVVAVAKIYKCSVITYEKPDGNIAKPKIPMLCKENGIECFDFTTFFEKEDMTFNIKSQ